MEVKYGKYNPISNNTQKNNNKNYLIKKENPQNMKKAGTTFIKIDLSKYMNNSKKETNNNSNIQYKTLDASINDYKNQSKSRYINRSQRKLIEKDNKIRYKKVYIELYREKNDKKINTHNNKNNFFVESKDLKKEKKPNNAIFNNKLNFNREKNYNNINTGGELKRIENIYLNIHNNNVIKNNNNILIKQNENEKEKQQMKNNFINLNIRNISKENNSSDEYNDLQSNFFYDKNQPKEKENNYLNINKEYLKKYVKTEDSEIKSKENNNLNINYMDYIKKEEEETEKENINKNLDINKNKNLKKNEYNTEYFNINDNKNNDNKNLGNNETNFSINNSTKFKEYNNYYGTNNYKDINNSNKNELINIKSEKEFYKLIPKKTFRKFLTNKIKYYMKEDSIPKKFISDFIVHNKKSKKSHISDLHNTQQPQDNIYDFDSFKEYYENKNIITEINRSKSKNKKKKQNLVLMDENKLLMDEINKLREYVDNSKSEIEQRDIKIKRYLQTYDKISIENEENKKRIENLEHELDITKNEMQEKKNEINELSNINYNLEKEMKKLKKEVINSLEAQENYSIIKNNYNDIKNQYDLLNIKYKTLSDENYNFKRDKILYEKELKSKNNIIDDLIQIHGSKKKELKGKLNKLELNNIEEKEIKDYLSSSKKEKKEINENKEEKIKNNQINTQDKKDKKVKFFEKLNINELMDLRDELVGERNFITNEFYKIPTKATIKQNQRRNELEKRLAQINNELAKIRIRINILKESKKIKKI